MMTQEVFPEIQAATAALEQRISATKAQITQMNQSIAIKKRQIRAWRKAIKAVNPPFVSELKPIAAKHN